LADWIRASILALDLKINLSKDYITTFIFDTVAENGITKIQSPLEEKNKKSCRRFCKNTNKKISYKHIKN
jgi:hypothetical protein